eukprot:4042707-Pleurochrysis_carterae.AAC.1
MSLGTPAAFLLEPNLQERQYFITCTRQSFGTRPALNGGRIRPASLIALAKVSRRILWDCVSGTGHGGRSGPL